MLLLRQLIDLYSLVVVAAVVVSWIDLPRHHPVLRFLHNTTEPVLAPVRRILPPLGGIDFSPLVVLLGLRMIAAIF